MAGNTPPFSAEYLNANKGGQVIAIITVFPCLALLVVGLRLYTRWRIVHNASWEDYSILGALVRGRNFASFVEHCLPIADFQHCNINMPGFP
jgi:hypothetical protein